MAIDLTKPRQDSTDWGGDMNQNLDDIEGAVNDNENDIDGLEVDVAALDDRVGDNETDIATNVSDISDLGDDLDDVAALVGNHDRGDPTTDDWDQTSLTTDGSWHDLDCSSIVPAGASIIHFVGWMEDNIAAAHFNMRKNGNSNAVNMSWAYTAVANGRVGFDFWVSCSEARVVEYRFYNTTWTFIRLTVAGWLWSG